VINLNFNKKLKKPPTNSLRPIIPNNARPLRITAIAGTKVNRDFFSVVRQFPITAKELYSRFTTFRLIFINL